MNTIFVCVVNEKLKQANLASHKKHTKGKLACYCPKVNKNPPNSSGLLVNML